MPTINSRNSNACYLQLLSSAAAIVTTTWLRTGVAHDIVRPLSNVAEIPASPARSGVELIAGQVAEEHVECQCENTTNGERSVTCPYHDDFEVVIGKTVKGTVFQSDDSNMSSKLTLIHVPVGNNPARIRLLIYLKGLEDQIDISTPADYGGMSSDAYRALNPQCKIPTLLLPDGSAVYESRGCGYKGVELIDAPARAAKLREVAKQVGVLEGLVVGPYAAGAALTEADCALYPTLALLLPFCLEHAFGWPTLYAKWLAEMEKLPAAQRVRAEVEPALQGWLHAGRFEPIRAQVAAAASLAWDREAVMASL
ncbi:hypothetical protein EMIHUDRAFT_202969 [Emiliania huxleyi CCMP1516]|uniref:GST N-terminal domain-containing protein n=2 Tax=Emiliania huxleyi TaxID=2903 RepID=A0A0D3K597_EMIH1|nr:hypothetical protein EMIHUDRAFT_202969 [Emiliania huxleyi CCMP1516]EOD30932.1 hypothetical protein EMIHUDRAFT_202969 [Emiliania huxleyi CCMP1516]|eukprot:XP_005783361.1 hypothetical protein EMIHUDRAFT_202969 [Emiliania huxleyi CCMP1516]